jgi:hypothetical protein
MEGLTMKVTLRIVVCGVVTTACATLAPQSKTADIYVGAGVHQGDARVAFTAPSLSSGISFKKKSTSWNAVIGVRPLSLYGAELEHVDFGSVGSGPQMAGSQNVGEIRGRLSATSVFGLLYLPIPSSALDIYAKAGYARINGRARTYPTGAVACPAVVPAPWYCFASHNHDLDDNAFASGVGVKVERGSWGVRAEYEAFIVKGPNASVVSLNIVKSLL